MKKKSVKFMVALGILLLPFLFSYCLRLEVGISCGTNMKALSRVVWKYQRDHDGLNPPTSEVLYSHPWVTENIKKCPSERSWSPSVSYVYRGSDLTEDSPSELILMYEKHRNHMCLDGQTCGRKIMHFFTFYLFAPKARHVVFSNGIVYLYSDEEFNNAIQRDNDTRKKLELKEKKIEW